MIYPYYLIAFIILIHLSGSAVSSVPSLFFSVPIDTSMQKLPKKKEFF